MPETAMQTALERRAWTTPQVFRLDGKETENGSFSHPTMEGETHINFSTFVTFQQMS